jgi:hypothetical protein
VQFFAYCSPILVTCSTSHQPGAQTSSFAARDAKRASLPRLRRCQTRGSSRSVHCVDRNGGTCQLRSSGAISRHGWTPDRQDGGTQRNGRDETRYRTRGTGQGEGAGQVCKHAGKRPNKTLEPRRGGANPAPLFMRCVGEETASGRRIERSRRPHLRATPIHSLGRDVRKLAQDRVLGSGPNNPPEPRRGGANPATFFMRSVPKNPLLAGESTGPEGRICAQRPFTVPSGTAGS